ncbi:unnamed protein product [Adineta ricciae]|uniref:G-protein coupled receptors family 1 profile domain-containing protein n=1 Tax=Adineta ricciae TaxID=249248 RepID=A0A814S6H1_ADIRI|nr:unnamed protein product [Adineta ricciae]
MDIPFAFIAFTTHRCCSLLYHTKVFFKTKQWITICITLQWIIQFILSLPFIFRSKRQCMNELWLSIYTFIVAVVLPSLINIILNSLIFVHVRSSVRRVQPNIATAWTSGFNREQQQLPKISRREIALLRQMVFMFIMFVTVPFLCSFPCCSANYVQLVL